MIIEYLEAIPSPTSLPPIEHPDWVSCVRSYLYPTNQQQYVITSCYDSRIRVFNNQQVTSSDSIIDNNNAVCEGVGHISSIKQVSVQTNNNYISSVSKDRTVRLWQLILNDADNNKQKSRCIQVAHADTEQPQEACHITNSMVCIT